MKRMLWTAGVLAVALATGLTGLEADARRLGGGGSAGMSRSLPARPAQQNTPPHQAPAQNAATNPAAAPAAAGATAGAAAQAGRRSWLGPIAGIAAGLGLAALMSHLGLGAAFGEFLTLALLVIVAIVAVRFLMRRFGAGKQQPQGMRYAGATATAGAGAGPAGWPGTADAQPTQRAQADWGRPAGAAAPAGGLAPMGGTPALSLPAEFDREAFERIAKLIFIRMQAANDAGNLDDLRQFTTPEMFAAARLDLHNRGGGTQRTDVVQLEAEVMDLARENGQDVVSVRYHGLIREDDAGQAPQPFDEVWHLVRPTASESNAWAVAGIQQTSAVPV